MIQAIRCFPNQPTKTNQGARDSSINESNFSPDLINEVRVDHIKFVTYEIQKDWHRHWSAYISGSISASELHDFKRVFERHCMVEQRQANHEAKIKTPTQGEMKKQRDKLLNDFYKYGQ